MRIYPASHYTMGGLWVDYELMTTVPGLYCAGEANFSDHGANRLGASALMQGLADGYFVLPNTISNYLAPMLNKPIPGTDHPAFAAAEARGPRPLRRLPRRSVAPARPTTSTASSARSSGTTAAWSAPPRACEKALSEIPALYDEFQKDLRVTGPGDSVNQTLEKAGRVDDFFQLGMLMCRDALERRESCGGHFRAEYQDEEGEAQRDDDHFAHVAAWEWTGDPMNADPPPGRARATSTSTSPSGATSERRSPDLTLKIWRQDGPDDAGHFESYAVEAISDEASFLELLDVLNERLIAEGKDAITFDHDCREGICGTCSLMIDGQAHGPQRGTATCQLHMRTFQTAPRSSSSRGGRRPSRSSRT